MAAPFVLTESQKLQKEKKLEILKQTRNTKTNEFIKEKKLEKVILNEKEYPLYLDGTVYYKDPYGFIYRFTLNAIYLTKGNGNEKLIMKLPY